MTASQTTLYLNDPASGVSLEKSTGSSGTVTWNLYIRSAGGLVAQRIEQIPPGGGAAVTAMRYYVSDHLSLTNKVLSSPRMNFFSCPA